MNDRTHGLQFRASFLKASPPTTLEGIERYLGSGMIRGIGPVYAKRLVQGFGEAVFDLIEQQPERLREVTGIGPKRAAQIIAGWAEQKVDPRDHAVPARPRRGHLRAVRIYKTYGTDAVQVISENPYRLARDIRGIGFLTADRIAAKLGIEKTAMVRVRAGISYALAEAMDEGHCGLPVEELTTLARKLLEVPAELIETALGIWSCRRALSCRHAGRSALCLPHRPVSGRAGDCGTVAPPLPPAAILAERSMPAGRSLGGGRTGLRWRTANKKRCGWRCAPRCW